MFGRVNRSSRGVTNIRPSNSGPDTSAYDQLFLQYASSSGSQNKSNSASSGDTGSDDTNLDLVINEEGTEKLCSDLGFTVFDPVALVWCYHCAVRKMGIFTRQEFIKGCLTLGGCTIQELKSHVPDMREQLHPQHPLSKKVYINVFLLSLEEGQKQLPRELAVEMWKLLFPLYDSNFDGEIVMDESDGNEGFAVQTEEANAATQQPAGALSKSWIEFILSKNNKKGLVSKDVWNTTFDLITQCNADLSNYDLDGGAWPVMIDEFVILFRKRRGL